MGTLKKLNRKKNISEKIQTPPMTDGKLVTENILLPFMFIFSVHKVQVG